MEEKKMFNAVCSVCNNTCQVPFQPKTGQPITCKSCWAKQQKKEKSVNTSVPEASKNEFFAGRQESIVAQCLTKEVCANATARNIDLTPDMVWDIYVNFIKKQYS